MSIGVPRQIKIIYVIGQLTVGGSERQLLELVRNLTPQKFKVMVVSLSGQAPLAAAFRDAGCDVHLLERETRGRFSVLLDLYHLFSEVQPHIVHAYAYASRAAIPVARFFPKCKTIVSIRTQPEWQMMLLDKITNSFADYRLTNSQKAWASLRFGFFRTVPCQVIYNGIDLEKFDFAFHDGATSHPGQAGHVICAVARLQPVKGLDVLLKAFARVVDVCDPVFLWIIGSGPELENLKKLSTELRISANVIFWGEQLNVAGFLRHVDIGVLSSHVEGLPNVILEYMAAALPVVSTNVGGIPELVSHYENGLLVAADHPQELADALITLLKDRELAKKLGQAGRVLVAKKFDLKNMIHATETVYETLCQMR
jgi:glycosyltransferase involved in cell wall biosynthesis